MSPFQRGRLLAGALSTTLLLSACMGGAAETDGKDAAQGYDPKANVEIVWWTGQDSTAQKIVEGLAAEYHTAHPNVTIKVSPGAPTTDDLLAKLSAAFAGNTHPDISYSYGSWAGELAASGKTQDLTEFVNDPAVDWKDFPVSAQETASPKGKTIGFPAVVDNMAVYYNKKVFDDASVEYPKEDWTWADFRETAKKLTDTAKKQYGMTYSVSGSEDTTWHLWPLLWQNGGKVLDENKPAFNSEAGVAALETLRQMAVDDKSMYLDQTDEKYGNLFMENRIGMMISGPWSMLDAKEKKTDYGVVQLPAGPNGSHETISGPDIWALYNHDDANRAGAARDFVKWLTSAETDAKFNLAVGNMPLRKSEEKTPEFAKYVKEYPGGQAFFKNFDNVKQSRPTVAGYEQLSRNVGEAVSSVLQGKQQPKEALDEAAKKSADAVEE